MPVAIPTATPAAAALSAEIVLMTVSNVNMVFLLCWTMAIIYARISNSSEKTDYYDNDDCNHAFIPPLFVFLCLPYINGLFASFPILIETNFVFPMKSGFFMACLPSVCLALFAFSEFFPLGLRTKITSS